MPVEDHPVHDSTRRVGKRPGCWDRPPLKKFLWVKDGFRLAEGDAGHVLDYRIIPHAMSTDCKSDYQECVGCTNYQGEKNGSNT
jgi:hypothetical protein